jgi:geranylgeranyl reductase family protein
MTAMPTADSTDVAVVGAGPAGSAAAITLARLGRRVTLIDKAVFPRDKCCGDGLTTAALRRVEHLGLDPKTVESWEPVKEVAVVATPIGSDDPRGRRVDFPFPDDGTLFAASARRVDLDAALVELAKGAGVEILQGRAVTDVTPQADNDAVAVTLDDGSQVVARYAIAADGMWSTVRKALGLSDPGYLGDWQAGRQYFENVGPQADKLWVWFEPDMIPGYAWSFPLPGRTANVGYGVIRLPGQSLGQLKGQQIDFLARPRIAEVLGSGATPIGPWKAWPIPARIGDTTLSGLGGRVLFAGDAARACDPMTGEGIAQALETAEMVARAIAVAGPRRPAAAATRYERQVRWGLAVDDRLSRKLSWVVAHTGGSEAAMRIADRTDRRRRNFPRWMFEDYPRAVFVTPHRWRRRTFSGPGAYRGLTTVA